MDLSWITSFLYLLLNNIFVFVFGIFLGALIFRIGLDYGVLHYERD